MFFGPLSHCTWPAWPSTVIPSLEDPLCSTLKCLLVLFVEISPFFLRFIGHPRVHEIKSTCHWTNINRISEKGSKCNHGQLFRPFWDSSVVRCSEQNWMYIQQEWQLFTPMAMFSWNLKLNSNKYPFTDKLNYGLTKQSRRNSRGQIMFPNRRHFGFEKNSVLKYKILTVLQKDRVYKMPW